MAATVSDSSTILRQSRAAMVPMLTLSWLCASVLRLKAEAGMVSFEASAAMPWSPSDISDFGHLAPGGRHAFFDASPLAYLRSRCGVMP